MKISVIIPSYKPKEYLWACLDSLCRQTLDKNEYEVILVLNGCNEPYASQIKQYISKQDGIDIKLIQTDVAGVSNARNLALDNAIGEYIAFIDDDDLVSEYYLEGLLLKASRDTVPLAYPYAFNDGNLNYQKPYSITKEYEKRKDKGRQKQVKVRKYFSGPWMKLIHRDMIGDRRFDLRFANGEDSLFMFLLSDRMRWVDFASSNTIYFRRYREGSAVTKTRAFSEVLYNCWALFKEYTRVLFSDFRHYKINNYIRTTTGLIHVLFNQLTHKMNLITKREKTVK